ncbi:FecCD family ABC transporter permease [Billgrantia gudaonensis]|uniref:Iron complex transport system permease protein n=1 Tax=Billgrantia gudaonensis TaxID=376427 RepID=A0A1G8SQ43_9GAMM|nr:iron ABC transporter permease [Halomonas gudaonensis]SDJ31327.1 iron complex transport system permease protein [Halomonas gudaonensis]
MLKVPTARIVGLLLGVALAVAAAFASLVFGATEIAPTTLMDAVFRPDPESVEHLILRTERLPRAAIAALVGASLAVAGALMQTLTRNALAAPSVLGINAGAMCFVVVASAIFALRSPLALVWVAFLGALVAALLVASLGRERSGGLSPVRLVLAGVAVTALFVSLAQGLLIVDQARFESLLLWLAGSVAGRGLEVMTPLLPFFVAAALLCLLLVRQLNLLALDDDVVKGLGQRTGRVKLLAGAVIIVLAGGAVAMAGMIGFVGLIVPHMVRALYGRDHRWLLPGCALLGATLLLVADTLARFLMPPQEVPVGVMTALLGTPFFLYLARRRSLTP